MKPTEVHKTIGKYMLADGEAIVLRDALQDLEVTPHQRRLRGERQHQAAISGEYARIRENHSGRRASRRLVSFSDARRHRFNTDRSQYRPPVPSFTGLKVFEDYDLSVISSTIDWSPFFKTWELSGRFPEILEDATVGEAARTLFDDAQNLLTRVSWLAAKRSIAERWLHGRVRNRRAELESTVVFSARTLLGDPRRIAAPGSGSPVCAGGTVG